MRPLVIDSRLNGPSESKGIIDVQQQGVAGKVL